MSKQTPITSNVIMAMTLLIVTTGCDDRAVQLATEAADRQAQQNETMAELNREIAGGSRRLVEADAQARGEMVIVHKDLQAERGRLDSGWTHLNDERRKIAAERRTESLLTPAVKLAGGLLLVVTLLGFCWRALVASSTAEGSDEELSEVLLQEFLDDNLQIDSAGPEIPKIEHEQSKLPLRS